MLAKQVNSDSSGAVNEQLNSLIRQFNSSNDLAERLEIAKKITRLDQKRGLEKLLQLLKECPFPFLREEILQAIKQYTHDDFGYDSLKDNQQNRAALKAMEERIKTL